MGEQIHKRLTDEQMKMIVEKYLTKELSAAEAMELLCLKRRQFFAWVQKYRNDPERFTMAYRRTERSRKLDEATHAHILSELAIEKALVDDPSIPVRLIGATIVVHRETGWAITRPRDRFGKVGSGLCRDLTVEH